MYKISQRELLDEGFWSDFAAPKLKKAYQTAKEVGKLVLPKTSENISKIVSGTRSAANRVEEAGTKMTDRIKLWLDEQGFYVKTPLKLVKKFSGGDKHYATEVALKEVDPNSGETVEGRNFKYPRAIILYNREKNMFRWAVKPNRNQMLNR